MILNYASERDFNMIPNNFTGNYPRPNYGIVYERTGYPEQYSHILYGKFDNDQKAISQAVKMYWNRSFEHGTYDIIVVHKLLSYDNKDGGYYTREVFRKKMREFFIDTIRHKKKSIIFDT